MVTLAGLLEAVRNAEEALRAAREQARQLADSTGSMRVIQASGQLEGVARGISAARGFLQAGQSSEHMRAVTPIPPRKDPRRDD